MFHLMIGLWAMVMLVAVILLALVPLWVGPLLQLLISLVSQGKIARWIPAVLGAMGLSGSVRAFCGEGGIFPLWGVLLYWAIYGLLLWAAYAMADRFRAWVRRMRQRRR